MVHYDVEIKFHDTAPASSDTACPTPDDDVGHVKVFVMAISFVQQEGIYEEHHVQYS